MSLHRRFAGLVALVGLAGGAAALAFGGPRTPAVESSVIRVGISLTIYPTQIPPFTPAAENATPEPVEAPAAAATPEPSATPRVAQYVIKPGDTLWDIALRFGFASPDSILAANPGLNPDFLSLGQVLNIPGLDFIPPPAAQASTAQVQADIASANARVRADGGGLRLRREPVVADNVISKLSPLTSLQVLGRSADSFWLQVKTPGNAIGWVMAQYVEDATAPATTNVGSAVSPSSAQAQAAAAPSQPIEYPPYMTDISARVFEIYNAGQARGNRRNAFALIGDSNTENPKFFRPYDWGNYTLEPRYAHLEETIRFFKGSFDRTSPAARSGFGTEKALNPANADPECGGQSPVVCELNLQRPSIALVLIGTGDQHSWQGFEGRYRQIVETCIAYGVIPVLITKGDDLEHRDNSAPSGYINAVIRRVAAEYQVPLVNLSQVLDTLPARGFVDDGFHYNWPPDERPADLTADKLIYGFNQRNLTALQALDVIRRRVIGS